MSDTNDLGQDVVLQQRGHSEEPEAGKIQPGEQNKALPDSPVLSASYQFMGPIPSPQDLARYEAVIPGLGDRLINRFEKQSDHRMALESAVT